MTDAKHQQVGHDRKERPDGRLARFARRHHLRRHATIAFSLLPVITGCYHYAPVKMSDVTPGMGVRARVSVEASARFAPLLGATSARELSGTLIASAPDTIVVEVPAPGVPDPDTFGRVLNQRLSIPRSDLVELEARSLDRMRTAAIVGVSAAVLVTVLVKVMRGDPAMDKIPGGGGTESISPLLQRSR